MILDDLKKKNKVPTLFIGSGLSKRYLENYPTWFELLKRIGTKIGINGLMLNAIKNKIINDNSNMTITEINAKIADALSEHLNTLILEKNPLIDEIFTIEEQEKLGSYPADCFKYLVSKEFMNYKIKADKAAEIECFKKVVSKVGSVITTNYDRFLENEIFTKFNVKYQQNQLYFVNSYDYEAIYKIHGTADRPESLVINSKDYERIEENQRLFIAKVYDLLMNSPMIFMGYSMSDDDILKILLKFTECFDSSMLNTISKNIIMIEYKEGLNELVESQQIIKANGKSIPITVITTDNFISVFEYISNFELYLSPAEVNKYKKIISQLIKDTEKGSNKIRVVGDENVMDLDPNKVVIALGSNKIIDMVQDYGIVGMTYNDIVKRVLYRNELNIKSIVEKWTKENLAKKNNFPSFYLAHYYDGDINQQLRFKNNYDYLLGKFQRKVKEIGCLKINLNHNQMLEYSLKNNLDSTIEVRNLYYARIKDIITSDELRMILKSIYEKNNAVLSKSQFKELVCFSDFDLVKSI